MVPVSNPALKIHTWAPAATKTKHFRGSPQRAAGHTLPRVTTRAAPCIFQIYFTGRYRRPHSSSDGTCPVTLTQTRAARVFISIKQAHTKPKVKLYTHLTETVGLTPRPTGFHPASSSRYTLVHTSLDATRCDPIFGRPNGRPQPYKYPGRTPRLGSL